MQQKKFQLTSRGGPRPPGPSPPLADAPAVPSINFGNIIVLLKAMLLFSAYLSMFRYFVVIWRLSPPHPPLADSQWGGGILTPWTKFYWGGTKLSWGWIFWRCLWIQRGPPGPPSRDNPAPPAYANMGNSYHS